jgi:TolB protein
MTKRNYIKLCFLSYFPVARFAAVAIICLLGASIAHADTVFTASLNGSQAVPPTNSTATEVGSVILNDTETQVIVTLNLNGFQNAESNARIHAPASRGETAGQIFSLPSGISTQSYPVTYSQAADLKAGLWYFNVTSTAFPNGEIRGQIEPLCAPPPANMTAWYRGENNANDSIGSSNGTVPNGSSYPAGKVGQAFGFNGTNQYANFGTYFNYKTFTISMWVKPGQTQLAYANLVDNGRTQSANWVIEQNNTATNNYNYIDNGGSTSFILQPNVWQHLTIVRSENGIQIYSDGVLLNWTAATAPINYNAQRLLLARKVSNLSIPERNWNGQIDEFIVFDRALSETEIKSLYYSGRAGVCTDSTPFTERENGKIIFSRTGTLTDQIYTINKDGSDLRKISPNPNFSDRSPVFSPDGNKIAFVRNTNIYVMNADGSNPVDLFPSSMTAESAPQWSPDGRKISFTLGYGNEAEIYVMNADGTNPIRLTNNSVYDFVWGWSPDGRKLVYNSRHDNNDDVYTMNADGSNPVRLTNSPAQDLSGSWSPDGNQIAFFSNRTGMIDIFVMNADGSNVTNLSNAPSTIENYPSWSPDGTKIVFVREQNNSRQIWTMNANGTGQTPLLTDGLNNNPTWHWALKTQNTTVSPANGVKVTFNHVIVPGRTVATSLQTKQMPPLPTGYAPGSPIYDIRTSASYMNFVTVSFSVLSVPNASTCDNMRMMHFTEGAWREENNASPVFNSGVCTVSQAVSTLSPFMVAHINSSPRTAAISGIITYGITPAGQTAKLISDVLLTTTGSSYAAFNTNADGNYLLDNLIENGQYTVTPSRSGNINGITSFDATLVLRCVAAGPNCNLTENQRIAADSNNSNSITSFDATQILRYVAANAQTPATGQVGNWKFSPAPRNYPSLFGSLPDQNYEAILVGEVNGNWTPPANLAPAENKENIVIEASNESNAVSIDESADSTFNNVSSETDTTTNEKVSLPTGFSAAGENTILVPVMIANKTGNAVSSYNFVVAYNQGVLQPDFSKPFETSGTLSDGGNFTIVSDTNTPGRIGIAAVSRNGIAGASGTLLNLRFKIIGASKNTITTANNLAFLRDVRIEDNDGAAINAAGKNDLLALSPKNWTRKSDK